VNQIVAMGIYFFRLAWYALLQCSIAAYLAFNWKLFAVH